MYEEISDRNLSLRLHSLQQSLIEWGTMTLCISIRGILDMIKPDSISSSATHVTPTVTVFMF